MPRIELNEFVEAVVAAAPEVGPLTSSDYIAAGVKQLNKSDLPHITARSSNQTHVALTDVKGTMRLFPLVTSPLYENSLRKGEKVDGAEKTLYVNQIRFRGFRENLLSKLEACKKQPPGHFTYAPSHADDLASAAKEWPDIFEGSVTVVAQIRGSDQLQLELSRAEDSTQWKTIHSALDVEDRLVILQRADFSYDFVILQSDAIRDILTEPQREALRCGVQANPDVSLRVATVTPRNAATTSGIGLPGRSLIDKVVHACRTYGGSHFIVLWGVPATGKSFVAENAAKIVAGDPSRLRIVQFHPTYSYDDLFEGYQPNKLGGFDSRVGVLSDMNSRALSDPTHAYVLLIDEFSRADVPSVIGELLTHIEYRNRPFVTPFGKEMALAPNMVFLGTMNPQDRSALELDDAILRRFRTIKISPSPADVDTVLRASLDSGGDSSDEIALIERVQRLFAETEQAHPDEFDEQMPFGPWIFKGVRNWDELDLLWEQQIEQLIKRPGGTKHPFYDTIVSLKPVRVSPSGGARNDTGTGNDLSVNG